MSESIAGGRRNGMGTPSIIYRRQGCTLSLPLSVQCTARTVEPSMDRKSERFILMLEQQLLTVTSHLPAEKNA